MATFSEFLSGQKDTKQEELIEKWSGTLSEIDHCVTSAPAESKPNDVLERWLHKWKMLSANMTELFAECRRAGVPVPDLAPGDRTNYNRCKELQIKLEGVISSRKGGEGADESNDRQAGVRSLEPKSKRKAARKPEDGVPSTQEHAESAKVAGGKLDIKETENAREGCLQCASEKSPCEGVKGKSCPQCASKKRSCSLSGRVGRKRMTMIDADQHLSKKRSSSPQPLDAMPSDLVQTRVKRLRVKPPQKPEHSQGPSDDSEPPSIPPIAIQEKCPAESQPTLIPPHPEQPSSENIVGNPPIPPAAVLESTSSLRSPPTVSHAARVAQAEARIRKVNAELLNLQRVTTDLFSHVAELDADLREIWNAGEVDRNNDRTL
ncbi:hypothetical protein EDD16DRAFT_1721327 [Pisolithus croceorrhizus]|nr:hypothetical protein EDD16DRAFT_1721327 [Pisolithus croceorrhizus]KAI6159744.1 hypothetical protein EDD17DRAFT_1762213 [Pisolithus thermaeus]